MLEIPQSFQVVGHPIPFAVVAQLVEQRFRKAQVAGSSPVDGSMLFLPLPSFIGKRRSHIPTGFAASLNFRDLFRTVSEWKQAAFHLREISG